MDAQRINDFLKESVKPHPSASPSMYVLGKTLKAWAWLEGRELHVTTEGHPVFDEEMYFLNEHGIWLVE